jgi:hypothetical protein
VEREKEFCTKKSRQNENKEKNLHEGREKRATYGGLGVALDGPMPAASF